MLRSLDTRVVSCQKATQPAALKTNQAKKAAKTQAAPSQDVYEVVLEDTVCFPEGAEATDNLTTYFLKNVEGGGQPHDTGTISNAEGKTVKVSNVVRRGLTAVHFAEAPLEEGSSVSVQVDFDRRLDHMQQHTGQHLLSDTLEEHFGLETLGWSMSPFPTPSYIEIPRAPSAEEIQRLNSFCNQLIRDGAPITVNVTLQEELAERPSKLPEDYEGGVVREVQIHHPLLKMAKGPCCGTHLPNISMLQAMQILPNVTSIRGTNFRLYFLVGGRVLENAAKAMEAVRLSALQFGGTEDLPGRVEATLANLRDANRRERRLREELADFLADKLAAQAQQNSRRLALLVRQDEELDSLIGITSKLKTLPGAVDNPCFILISQNTSGSCPLVVIGEAARSKEVIDAMRAEFGARLKGGGKGIFQGKLEGKAGKKEIAFLESLLLSTE